MKKIILVILMFCSSNIALASKKGEMTPDTIQYLRDSIISVKSNYTGGPLSVLLNNLKITPVAYSNLIDFGNLRDTVYQTIIFIYFDKREFTPEVRFSESRKGRPLNDTTTVPNLHISSLKIVFSAPVPIKMSDMAQGHFLFGQDWSSDVASYFGQYIISDIEAIER